MEFYGSIDSVSGSITASIFTGSFVGDAQGLYNIQASGVTGLNLSQIASGNATASISSTGFTVNKNTNIVGNLSVTGSIIANQYIVSSSVTYMTTSFASGSSAFGNDENDVHQFTGSVEITGSISLNGEPIGTGKLNETTFNSYTSSNDGRVDDIETSTGSLNSFTSSIDTTIKSKLDSEDVISGSIQINLSGTTGFSTFSSSVSTSLNDISSSLSSSVSLLSSSIGSVSSSIAITDSSQDSRLGSIESKTGSYATTGSNLFKGNQTHSGSIIPAIDNFYDLGSSTHQWKDVYISSGSLYIDGSKVLSSTTQELTITTDNGQSIKILEGTTDSIVLQTADGNIELKSSAAGDILLDPTNGKITLKGPVEILSGQKIQSSIGGTPVVFANDIVVSGSIDLTGTIDGVDLSAFSSSVVSRLVSIEGTTGSLNTFTSSASNRLTSIETATSSINTFTSSINTTIKSKLDSDGVLSGSSQVILSGTTGFSTVSASLSSLSSSISITNFNQDGRLNSIETSTGSLNSFTSSIDTTIKNKLNTETVISGSVQVSLTGTTGYSAFSSSVSTSIGDLSGSVATTTSGLSSSIGSISSSIATTDLNQTTRLNSIEGVSGSYATTGSNTFVGSQTISGSVVITQNFTVLGSSSITYVTSSQLRVEDNIITVNTSNPGQRFGGIEVYDSGSITQATGSLLWDSQNNRWIYQQSSESTYGGGMLLSGPRSSGSLGTELTLTSGKIARSAGGDHLNDSIITEYSGTAIGVSGSLDVTGSVIITGTITSQGTTIVSGSGQISYAGITNVPVGIVSGAAQVVSSLPSGTVSGSSQVSYTGLSNIPTGIVSGSSQIIYSGITSIPTGIVSGAAQVTALLPTGTVSGSSQVLNGSGVWSGSAQLPSGIISGAAQLPSGTVSGSSQVLNGTTIHSGSFFNGISVVSGSSQISFSGLTGTPTGLVSGSSQITFGSISSLPALVSGSSQIDLTSTTNYASGILTRLNAVGVFSGSAQVTGIGNSQLTNSSFYVGTTSISLGRTSASQTLTGISIDGNAATVTGGVYTSGDQSISGAKTFSGTILMGSATRQMISLWGTQYGIGVQSSTQYFRTDGRFSWFNGGVHSDTENTPGTGGTTLMTLASTGNLTVTGTIGATNFSGTHSGTSSGTNTGDQTNISGNAATAGGFTPSQSSGVANRIVVADANGYIINNYFNTSGGGSERNASGISYLAGFNSSDYYIRSYTLQALGSAMSGVSMNISGTATNITAYTINQSVGSSNSPTFAGLTLTGPIYRSGAATAYLSGGYSGNETSSSTGAIYTIGGSYYPTASSLNNMYGIGYTNTNSGTSVQMTNASGWGMYVAANGTPYVWLGAEGNASVFRGNVLPHSNNSYNLGSASMGWANVYTNDLHLSNMNKPEGNDIDGTNGTWTIQEGAENLYIINNNNGKKYKIDLTEII